MFIAQTLSETCFDDEAQLHRTQVYSNGQNILTALATSILSTNWSYKSPEVPVLNSELMVAGIWGECVDRVAFVAQWADLVH